MRIDIRQPVHVPLHCTLVMSARYTCNVLIRTPQHDKCASQMPLGVLADRIGGIPVMQSSLMLWTLVTGVTSLIRNLPQQQRFPALLAARAALGLAQACIMPATSAMAAK